MKNIYKLLIYVLAMVSLSSCFNSWLDLKPEDGSESSSAINDLKSAKVVLTGIYDGIQGASNRVSYYGANMFLYGDVRGDDMQVINLGDRGSALYEMNYNADNAPAIWGVPYNVILRANHLIKAIDEGAIRDGSEKELNKMKAEALVIRALVHFDLCRVYGNPYDVDNGASLGIPIVLGIISPADFQTRNTVAEVYLAVIKDLEDALSIENGLVATQSYGYVNKWFAKGLLAKVNLYKGDNVAALKYAEDVIANSPYGLWTYDEYVDGWKTSDKGRKEMLFEIVNASTDDWTDREGIANLMNPNGYACIITTKSFLNMMESTPEDVRRKVLTVAIDEDYLDKFGESTVYVNKYPEDSSGEWRLNSLSVLRLSEVYLIAAEAAAKSSKADIAVKYLNVIHKRANPDAADLTEAEATLPRISLERRKELVGEGNRFFDAMRNNETITRYTSPADQGYHPLLRPESSTFNRTYYRTLLPIPVSEINVNAPIRAQQNPGY